MKPKEEWDRIIAQLSRLPLQDGFIWLMRTARKLSRNEITITRSMLGALGMLPGDGVARETMWRTLKRVMNDWQWDKTGVGIILSPP
jgi:hypothetical protein